MTSSEAAVRRTGLHVSLRRAAVLTAIAVTQVTWLAALAYGFVWLVT
jgi:hypothetical protein